LTFLRRGATAVISALIALSSVFVLTVAAADGLAADDAYPAQEDQALVVPSGTLLGLLDNDIGGSAVLCVLSVETTGLEGTLDLGGATDGSFTYTPPANFHGDTTFTYQVASKVGEACPEVSAGTAIVTISVASVNDAPTAAGDSFTALENHTLNVAAPGVLANDADVDDGDTLTAVKKANPAHGTVTLAQDGGFSYTPDTGYVGADQFSYWASDGTDHSPQRIVRLTVAALPPTPAPTPVPTAPPTPVPPTASPEPSPSESPEPSDSGLASPSPSVGGLPSPSASAGPVTGPVVGGGGLPIAAIGALALLLGLLAVAGVFFIRSQRAGSDGEAQPGYPGDDFDDEEPHG
jgi:hypothetical protein